MDLSAIGAVSIQMNLASVQQTASLSVMKKAMDLQATQAAQMIEGMQAAVPPPSTGKLDMLI